MTETPAQKKAREDEEALQKELAEFREAAKAFNPGKVEVELKEAPEKGHCPCCGSPPPRIGILLGPPWRHQLASMRAELANHRGTPDKADEIPIEEVHQALLKMHGGFIVPSCSKCGNSYLVRVEDWPAVDLRPDDSLMDSADKTSAD